MLRGFNLRGLWPRERHPLVRDGKASRGLPIDQTTVAVRRRALLQDADEELDPLPERHLFCEVLHCATEGEEAAIRRGLVREDSDEGAGAPVCLNPGCGKPSWNGEPGEYCSIDCRDAVPPKCKRPGCPHPSLVSLDEQVDEYCGMACKNKSTICLKSGCHKPSWNGRPKGFCSLACYGEADKLCMMPGCGKPTWNDRPAGFCDRNCRDKAKHMAIKRTAKKAETMTDLDKHIARMVHGKLAMMSKAEQEAVKAKQDYAKLRLLEATSGSDLLLRSELFIHESWAREAQALPGNIYSIGAFGRLADYRAETAHKTMGRVAGWVAIWFLQVIGPPAIWASTVFAWGIKTDMQFHWREWRVDLDDWHHIGLTKSLALIFQICFILNGLYVVLETRDDSRKIHSIIRYMQHYANTNFVYRLYLYIGAITNCWVVLWCCADTVVVLGSSQSPKDVIFDSLGLLFLYNLDDIGGELGFVNHDDWPGERLGWIYSEMVVENWHMELDGTSKEEFDEKQIGAGGCIMEYSFKVTIWILSLALVIFPVFNAMTPFLIIAPPDGGWPSGRR